MIFTWQQRIIVLQTGSVRSIELVREFDQFEVINTILLIFLGFTEIVYTYCLLAEEKTLAKILRKMGISRLFYSWRCPIRNVWQFACKWYSSTANTKLVTLCFLIYISTLLSSSIVNRLWNGHSLSLLWKVLAIEYL